MKSPAPALALVGRTRRMASKMEAANAEQWRLVKFIVGLSPPATETRRKGFKECGGTLSIAQPQGAAVYKPPNQSSSRVEPRKKRRCGQRRSLGLSGFTVAPAVVIGISPVANRIVTTS